MCVLPTLFVCVNKTISSAPARLSLIPRHSVKYYLRVYIQREQRAIICIYIVYTAWQHVYTKSIRHVSLRTRWLFSLTFFNLYLRLNKYLTTFYKRIYFSMFWASSLLIIMKNIIPHKHNYIAKKISHKLFG